MTWFHAYRTAILSGLAAALAVIVPHLTPDATGQLPGIDVVVVLAAVVAGLSSGAAAYRVLGLTAKLIIGVLITALAAVGSGLEAGLPVVTVVVTTISLVVAELLVESALPSTEGSAAIDARVYGDGGDDLFVPITTAGRGGTVTPAIDQP